MDLGYNILIVDDVVGNIQVAMNILKEDNYSFSFAKDGVQALALMQNNHFDLVLLDVMMPGIDGFEVCKKMRQIEKLAEIPVIFLTARVDTDSVSRGFEVGGVDYISKPFQASELLARVRTHLELYRSREVLKRNNISLKVKMAREQKRLFTELEETQKEIIYMLMEIIESISDETGEHVKRVAQVSRLLADKHPALTDEDSDIIYHTAPMHDVGKLAVPYDILHKPDKFTPQEFEIMKRHTTQAHKFLRGPNRKFMKAADIIAYEHHEKWDGSGYPRGLKEDEIHIYARVVALADVFDALLHKRVYKHAWSIDETLNFVREQSGKHFDPQLVDILLTHKDEILTIISA